MIDLLILDVDNTVYPKGSGLFATIDERINLYLTQFLGLDSSEANELRSRYRDIYDISLVGLMRHHDVNPRHFLDFVHDVEISRFLSPDPELGALIEALAVPTVVLTNGSREYAGRVLATLGIEGRIEELVAIEDLEYVPKPHPDTFRRIYEPRGLAPGRCLLVDDMERNLAGAKEAGLLTGLVHPKKSSLPHTWDFAAPDIKTMLQLLLARMRGTEPGPP